MSFGCLAQLVEHPVYIGVVGGSSPSAATVFVLKINSSGVFVVLSSFGEVRYIPYEKLILV